MPIYDYFCEKCQLDYEIIKSIKEYDGKDKCPTCGELGARIPSCNIFFVGEKVESAEYNPGLGKVTKNKKHRDELAKRMNLIEIGNENPDTLHKNFDNARAEKFKKAYDDI